MNCSKLLISKQGHVPHTKKAISMYKASAVFIIIIIIIIIKYK